MLRLTVIVLSCVLWVNSALADDVTSFDVVLGDRALICDKPESVQAAMMGIPMPDCGLMRTRNGMAATVALNGDTIVLPDGSEKPLAMFVFHNEVPWGNNVQYGWWAGEIPTALDIDA